MNEKVIRWKFTGISFFFLSVLVMLLPALRLGYPILHGDSGSYIISGFLHYPPVERPITYGLFVWISSLQMSLWFVVLIQAFITTFVMHVFLGRVFLQKYQPLILFITICILTLTTSLGYFACQIKPDFFLPLILLAMFAFLTGDGKITYVDIFLAFIIMIGLLSHLSHLPITTGLCIATLILSLLYKKFRVDNYIKKYALVFLLLVSAWILAPAINYHFTGAYKLSRVSNIFSMSRLLQAGVFQAYVGDRCKNDSTFAFCKYSADLGRYKNYYDFLWDDKSFLYDNDCSSKDMQYCWVVRDKEFGVLVDDIYSQEKYLKMIAKDAIKVSATQLVSFNIPDYASYRNHSFPEKMITRFLPADVGFLEKAKQNSEDLRFPFQNFIQAILVIISIVFIIFMMIWKKGSYINARLMLAGYMTIILLIGNAAFVGIFAGASDRFQSRLIWLIPLCALIMFFELAGIKRWKITSGLFKG
jgi:hypothetical protein